jgi:flagellar biosynthetic protein FliO
VDVVVQIISSVLLFGLVVFLAWLTTRLLGQHWGAGPRRGRVLSIREQVPVGKDRSIALVEVGDRLYLVGATAQGITLLDLITDPALIAQVRAATPPVPPLALGRLVQSFPALLQRGLGRTTPEQVSDLQPGQPATQNLADQLERLKRWRSEQK